MPDVVNWHCVIDYQTGERRYLGRSIYKAAAAYRPGTVLGSDPSESTAVALAMAECQRQQQVTARLGNERAT